MVLDLLRVAGLTVWLFVDWLSAAFRRTLKTAQAGYLKKKIWAFAISPRLCMHPFVSHHLHIITQAQAPLVSQWQHTRLLELLDCQPNPSDLRALLDTAWLL